MKTNAKPPRLRRLRTKMTLLVVLLCALLLALVWLLSVQLLEPMYERSVQTRLEKAADVYADILRRNGLAQESDALMEEILAHEDLLNGMCLDISGTDCLSVLVGHKMETGACILHPESASAKIWGDRQIIRNAPGVVELRAAVLQNGDMTCILPDPDIAPSVKGKRQMAVCRRIDGVGVLILSTGLERVGEAAGVIRAQMPVIAAVLLIVSIACAYGASRLFTKPILALSDAARRVAKGDYTARVSCRSNDELGALADDFNTMADEVGRTAQLQRDLLANVSHDLRTPLTLIKGYAETVRDLTGDDAEKRAEQLSVIIDETDRLSALVGSVMELSRYSSGAAKPAPVEFDLAQLVDEVACRYENICERSGCTLTVDAPGPCPVTADPDGMTRVVHNLLANAIHHVGGDGQILLHVHTLADGGVEVRVEDHGAGIAKEDLPYIFDKYYRARADAGKPGTGLGLSITKAILVQHGFAFGVNSTVGQGSTFWFIARKS